MKKDLLQSMKNLMMKNQCIMNYVISIKHFYPDVLNKKDFDELLNINNNLQNNNLQNNNLQNNNLQNNNLQNNNLQNNNL
jgi:hypothetical protein